MPDRISPSLRPIAARRRSLEIARAAGIGLLVGSIFAAYFAVMIRIGRPVAPGWPLGFLIAGPALGAVVGGLRRRDIHAAARAVDDHYRLDDRTISALDFLSKPEVSPLRELAIRDAESHLAKIDAAAVVPFRVPRVWISAAALAAIAIAMLLIPADGGRPAAAAAAPIEGIVAQAEKLAEDFQRLEKLAEKESDKDLRELVEQLAEKAEEMKQPGVDIKEALAKLSEMQAAIAAKQAQYNVGLVDARLQALGAALSVADSTQSAGRALQEGKFDQAVQELEKLENPPVERKDAKALEEKLREQAEAAGEVGLGSLSDAAAELAEGVKGGGKAKFQKAARTLAELTKSHSKRKKIKEILDIEVDALEEAKSECEECDKAVRVRRPSKTNSPSNNWGLDISGNTLGDPTKIASKREVQEITGEQSDGASEIETTHSVEGRQNASRSYRENYAKYKKMSESVLDSEPIPLGHRRTIRRYFELIRPGGGDASTDTAPR
ncbi:MAG: hypothetical protein SFX72_07545 [Isosphaeraceae bacterium]|nr:hypothetical protein [Isosphaeraceae bacterium]